MADTDTRAALVAGLRELAEFYDAHPDFPLPRGDWDTTIHIWTDDVDGYQQLVRDLGGQREKWTQGDDYSGVVRDFGGSVAIQVYTQRENVCVRRQVGVRTVSKPDPSAPTVEVEEPVYEWDCGSHLAITEAAG